MSPVNVGFDTVPATSFATPVNTGPETETVAPVKICAAAVTFFNTAEGAVAGHEMTPAPVAVWESATCPVPAVVRTMGPVAVTVTRRAPVCVAPTPNMLVARNDIPVAPVLKNGNPCWCAVPENTGTPVGHSTETLPLATLAAFVPAATNRLTSLVPDGV